MGPQPTLSLLLADPCCEVLSRPGHEVKLEPLYDITNSGGLGPYPLLGFGG